ncbi:MAG: hypothetical protein P4M05_26480 [Bradyrhizobium sp.]|nr:hypothetical protein [Bradyrhizobium sp.]
MTPADGFAQAPLDGLTRIAAPDPLALASSLANAAASIARLDQALAGHPLAQAFIYRMRLGAVRHQAAADGALIDSWHLAATIEGLRLRMDPYLRIIDRADILDKAKTALTLHQWLVEPDFDQEGEVQRAEILLRRQPPALHPLLAAAQGLREWIDAGETRPPMRTAMVRFWRQRHLFRLPVPLTGAGALRAGQSWGRDLWLPAYLAAIEREAADGLDLLYTMERAWFEARRASTGRRRDSHAAAVVDVLAAAPIISATTVAGVLGIAVKTAIRLLDELVAAGIAVEVTHRAKRRLFALAGLAPLRDIVRPPYRPDPNRGRGQPRREVEEEFSDNTAEPSQPLTPLERHAFEYNALEEAMAHLDAVVRRTRQSLTATAFGMVRGRMLSSPDPQSDASRELGQYDEPTENPEPEEHAHGR